MEWHQSPPDGMTDVQLKALSARRLKPFKGSAATRIGIENEPVIFGQLAAYLEQASYEHCPKITKMQVAQLRNVGLVESKFHSHLTCSTDHLRVLAGALDGDAVNHHRNTRGHREQHCSPDHFVG